MGVLKTLGLALLVALSAGPLKADVPLRDHVATCVGRLSAQMEHYWLIHDQAADRVEADRAGLIDILQALTTRDTAPDILANRINAKVAHAALLTRASFSMDAKVSHWASRQAEAHLSACDGLVLAAPETEKAAVDQRAKTGTPERETMNQTAVQVSQ